ncbi:OPT oligopeptide transporter [Zopfochytrium polystomum]|nr:OPT oligopeptide transporter [Zopfochytrium polystomum]
MEDTKDLKVNLDLSPPTKAEEAALEADSSEPRVSDSDLQHEELMKTASDVRGYGMVARIVSTEDDPTLPLFTFRYFVLAIGLACFGGVLGQIYYFKPQTLSISALFHLLLGFVGGKFLEAVIPRGIFNPGPFNIKEHVLIVITASTASGSALATELIAVENLFYNKDLGYAVSIFLILSSQLLGYGIAGLLRHLLVYPAHAYYPTSLSNVSLFNALHHSKYFTRDTLRFFGIVFAIIFCWEWIPEFVAPTLVGVSIFCLIKRDSIPFMYVFGGTNNNEGMGMFSLCFDWLYITSTSLTLPWSTLVNAFFGVCICYIMMPTMYYANIWSAQNFPFMAQDLFFYNGSVYDQTLILDANNQLNKTALDEVGLPYFSATNAYYLLVNNMSITAAVTHTLLWNHAEIFGAFKALFSADTEEDVHYKVMKKYKEVPQWWYLVMLGITFVIALGMLYASGSGLEWWAFIIAFLIATLLVSVMGFLYATTGFFVNTQTLVQLLSGYIRPGSPVKSMYFTLYGYNTVNQALGLVADLKLGQYMKVPPRAVFAAQVLGTLIGGLMNYVMTVSIIDNQRDVLLDLDGNLQWSGQNAQSFNSYAVSWGGLGKEMFGAGAPYQWVTYAFLLGLALPVPFFLLHKAFPKARFDLVNTAIIMWYSGYLTVGINSSVFMWILIGIVSQYYMRNYRPAWFNKFNYLLAAGLDAGTQVAVFIMTLTLFGGAGITATMPHYFLNPDISNSTGGLDYCAIDVPAE